MSKTPRYELHFRWGGFFLQITGRRTLLFWAALVTALVGAAVAMAAGP